jgi:RNA polymerase-binding transcription factor DksA
MPRRLTSPELATLAIRLDRRWDALVSELRASLTVAVADDCAPILGPADAQGRHSQQNDAMADLLLANLEHALHELRAIKVAKERMRGGTYGLCARCEQPQAPARLFGSPADELCATCRDAIDWTDPRGECGRRPSGATRLKGSIA